MCRLPSDNIIPQTLLVIKIGLSSLGKPPPPKKPKKDLKSPSAQTHNISIELMCESQYDT